MNLSLLFNSALIGILKQAGAKQIDAIKASFKYFQQQAEIEVWAFENKGNPNATIAAEAQAAMAACVANTKLWLTETFDEAGDILPQIVSFIEDLAIGEVLTVDPWKGSREGTQTIWTTWAQLAGLVTAPTVVMAPVTVPAAVVGKAVATALTVSVPDPATPADPGDTDPATPDTSSDIVANNPETQPL